MATLMEMLEAGVHFGHKKERSNPRMKEFTYALREGIFVIDLDKTKEALDKALEFLKKEVSLGKTVLFVGTKRQAKEIVERVAVKAGMPYVTKRWLGGTLTNFETVKKSITQMERLEAQTKSSEFEALTKKEKKIITDKLTKLQGIFTGTKDMKNLPDIIFVVDANREKLAIEEAFKMNIPIVALADTDADPAKITFPIPANDDAVKAIELVMAEVAEVFGVKPAITIKEEASEAKSAETLVKAEKTKTPKKATKKESKK